MSNNVLQLPMTPDAQKMDMLIRAYSFLKHAQQHASIGNEFDIMISLHNLDNAIEYILKIIILHLDIEEKTGKSVLDNAQLNGLIGDINKYLSSNNAGGLSHVAEIKMIRQLRNLVQHSITYPKADIDRYMEIGQSFFEKSLMKFFGLTISELAYSTLINDSVLKQHLYDAETALETQEYLKAVVSSRNAFDYAHLIFEQFHYDRIHLATALVETNAANSYLKTYIEELDERVTVISHGVDYANFVRYRTIIRDIPEKYNADISRFAAKDRDWSNETVLFCYTFAANAIYNWQIKEPLRDYKIEDFYDENRQIIMSISDIDIEPENKYKYLNCSFHGDYNGELFYSGKEMSDNVKQLAKIVEKSDGRILQRSVRHQAHREKSYLNEVITDISIDITLVSHAPAIWRTILWYKKVPFSCDFNTPDTSINDITLDDLIRDGIEKAKAEILLKEIKMYLPIDTMGKAFAVEKAIVDFEEYGKTFFNTKRMFSRPLLEAYQSIY